MFDIITAFIVGAVIGVIIGAILAVIGLILLAIHEDRKQRY